MLNCVGPSRQVNCSAPAAGTFSLSNNRWQCLHTGTEEHCEALCNYACVVTSEGDCRESFSDQLGFLFLLLKISIIAG